MGSNLLRGSLIAFLALFAASCEVTKEEAGEAPDVDVQVDPGEVPEYEVEGPEVEVGTEQQEVTVPEVEVTQEEETITTPDVDVELPSEDPE
ncbi:MAG: hypothetical protein F6K04_22710 [Leptolyngbya sp. SIO4C5]|uniref:hypothetical protein n=1 Tax=Sphaerothrix gracilis TaxID=3151835 RepID=UPI0013BEFF91|nr:hypothetical protein [Leptolyngbya sp. SIO4C5]